MNAYAVTDHPLTSLATMRSGYAFRKALQPSAAGAYLAIQLRDVNDANRLDMEQVRRVDLPRVRPADILRRGDVLFRSRGARHTAMAFDEDLDNMVAASQFFILRVRNDRVLPGYLAWYINQEPAQRYFQRHATGTDMQQITKKVLGALEVPVPPRPRQERIVKMAELVAREMELSQSIEDRRRKLLGTVILHTIWEE